MLGFLTMYLANRDRLPNWDVSEMCRLLGEAEWYVGTHGGANDQTTILCNRVNSVLYNRHSQPTLTSTPLPFLRGIHVVLANSLWEVNKSLTGNQSFNMRKGWMEIGDEVMKLVIAAVSETLARVVRAHLGGGTDVELGQGTRLHTKPANRHHVQPRGMCA